jgi:pyrimidine operon attenuation protein/uracil phosphoribosyltransferase|tara:strand:+ start:4493 stop:5041 length:549 start_codon:yes stop_codon:yes gene_type:complete
MTNVSKLFDSKRLEITIDRLCQQIIENHKEIENFILIGLQPRGVYFLDRIKAKLEKSLNNEILTGYLDTTFYRDDLKSKNVPEVRETKIPDSLDGKDVVIVDDVLFTGRTVRSAMEGIINFGRPRKIELLVLIDRNYSREIPIEPTYCGIKLNTITSDRVKVNLTEQGFEEDSITIKNNSND